MRFFKSFLKLEFLVFLLIVVSFFYKLNYHYFFTDEILYVNRGAEQLRNEFSGSLQIPPLPKYLSGIAFTYFDHDAFFLRMPFVLLSLVTVWVVFLIVRREFNRDFGVVAMLLFATSRIIFDSGRLVMLEAPLHLFWLLFHYFYFQTFSRSSQKLYIASGVFFGLSFASKLTSLALIPFVMMGMAYKYFFGNVELKTLFKNYTIFAASGIASLSATYLHYFLSSGIFTAVIDTLRDIKGIYFTKSAEGKLHVIGDNVYLRSPWWSYIYYHVFYNGILRTVFYPLLALFGIFSRSFFVTYWSIFFVCVFSFYQFSGVKNARYISSFEIPLIMLSVAGIHHILSKTSFKRTLQVAVSLALLIFSLQHFVYLQNLQPTEYLGLWNYFRNETNEFKTYKRLYVFGSVRSMKWYRDLIPNKNMFIYRRDYEIMCTELKTFDYFAFDKEELLKDPKNFLYQYVTGNKGNFVQISEVSDMHVYKRINNVASVVPCPVTN